MSFSFVLFFADALEGEASLRRQKRRSAMNNKKVCADITGFRNVRAERSLPPIMPAQCPTDLCRTENDCGVQSVPAGKFQADKKHKYFVPFICPRSV